MRIAPLSLIAALTLSTPLLAAGVKIENAWVRPTVPGQKVVGAFMKLTADTDSVLLQAASPSARTVELHFMRMADGMMEMRELKQIDLPRGNPVSLEPGGMHIMLIGLKAPIKAGAKVPLTLTVRDAKGGRQSISTILEARTTED